MNAELLLTQSCLFSFYETAHFYGNVLSVSDATTSVGILEMMTFKHISYTKVKVSIIQNLDMVFKKTYCNDNLTIVVYSLRQTEQTVYLPLCDCRSGRVNVSDCNWPASFCLFSLDNETFSYNYICYLNNTIIFKAWLIYIMT